MPIHLPPIDRRRFLAGTLAAGTGLLLPRQLPAQEEPPIDPNLWVLLADIHIGHPHDKKRRGVRPAEKLEQAVREILALSPRPAGVIVAGDCAFLHGESGDYVMIGKLIGPLRRAGVPIHFALGNHDNRERFLAAFPEAKKQAAIDPGKFGKYVSVLETPHANWFLLDSLEKTDFTPGLMGEAQLAWLAKALDARPDKPALVLAHHNPNIKGKFPAGLKDTEALLKVLMPRKQAKAYFYGHTHCWNIGRRTDLHLVNIPATAWLFNKSQPRGFITVQLRSDVATFELHALDRKHAKHGEKIDLKWRT